MSKLKHLYVLLALLTGVSLCVTLAPMRVDAHAIKPREAGIHTSAIPPRTVAGVRPNREVFAFAFGNASLGDPGYGYQSWAFNLLTTVVYFGLTVDWDGTFIQSGSGWTTWNSAALTSMVSTAHAYGTRVILSVNLHDASTSNVSTMCAALHPLHRAVTVSQAMAQIQAMHVDGINLNYEGSNTTCQYQVNGVSPTTRDEMTSLAKEMRAALGPGGYLAIDTYSGSPGDQPANFFDLATLATYVDSIMVMTYDMEYSNQYYPPVSCSGSQGLNCLAPTSPLTSYYYNDHDVMASYIAAVGAGKVIMGIPYYGRKACVASAVHNAAPTSAVITEDYQSAAGEATDPSVQPGTYVTHRDAFTGAERWDTWYSTSLGCTRELYWDDAYSLGRKYDLINSDNLRGAGIFALQYGANSPELWNVLVAKFTNWSANYDMSQAPTSWQPGVTRTFNVNVTNTGPATWPAGTSNYTALNIHFATAAGGSAAMSSWLSSDTFRLPADVTAGQTVAIPVTLTPPTHPGPYILEAEMFTNQLYWFSAWQPISVRVAPVLWAATYDMSAAPLTWGAGQTQTFAVTVKNTGNQPWPAGGPNPVDLDLNFSTQPGGSDVIYPSWMTSQIYNLPADVPAGGSATINVSVTAPVRTGSFYLEAQLFKHQQFWFPTWQPLAVSVGAAGTAWSASYDLSATPASWQPGQTQSFNITVKNTGSQAWPSGGANNVALDVNFSTQPGGSAVLYSSWLTSQIFNLPADVAPGASVTLNVAVTAPQRSAGLYLEAQMFKNQQFWFGAFEPLAVTVGALSWSAGYDLSAAPRSWGAGQTATFAVIVKNTGSQAWPSGGANPVALDLNFSTQPGGSAVIYSSWLTSQIFNLPADVAPGGTAAVSVTVTAPRANGTLYLEAQMFKNQQFWFPSWQPEPVQVALGHWWASVDMSAAPSGWTAGQPQTFTVTLKNLGNQTWPSGTANNVALDIRFASSQGGPSFVYTWLTSDIVNLAADLAPGQTVQLSVTVKAPATPGSYYLEGQMFKNQQFWIQAWSPAAVTVS